MALAQLIYVSRLNKAMLIEDLEHVVEQSKANNKRRNITGMLLCHGRNLMQLLEGELADIASLFEKIRHDTRHFDAKCLLCKNVNKRMFPEWGMELASLDGKANLDRDRLIGMIEDIRANADTSHYAVEARVLLQDFRSQLNSAA